MIFIPTSGLAELVICILYYPYRRAWQDRMRWMLGSLLRRHYQIPSSWATFLMRGPVSITIGAPFCIPHPKLSSKSVNLKVRITSFIYVQTVYCLLQLAANEGRKYLMVGIRKDKYKCAFCVCPHSSLDLILMEVLSVDSWILLDAAHAPCCWEQLCEQMHPPLW